MTELRLRARPASHEVKDAPARPGESPGGAYRSTGSKL
jgi:hypothetical protein